MIPRLFQSGRQDSNLRPFDPQSNALSRLRHAPSICNPWNTRPGGLFRLEGVCHRPAMIHTKPTQSTPG